MKFSHIFLFFSISYLFAACSGSKIFSPKSQKDNYEVNAKKLYPSATIDAWQNASSHVLANPVVVGVPYAEHGRLDGKITDAVAFKFLVKAGQTLNVEVKRQTASLTLFAELWSESGKLLLAADTLRSNMQLSSFSNENFILRLIPNIGGKGLFTVVINTQPTFTWPIAPGFKSNIISVWGDPRDGGARKHEGIDIGAAKGTTLVAVMDGKIIAVNEDEIGGKIIYLKPTGQKYQVYYAHLNEQLVQDGQQVKRGEPIGTVGNTGNAKYTVPHLHFGIYGQSGAVNPIGFVQETAKANAPQNIDQYATNRLTTKGFRLLHTPSSKSSSTVVSENTSLQLLAVCNDFVRVQTGNGLIGFVEMKNWR